MRSEEKREGFSEAVIFKAQRLGTKQAMQIPGTKGGGLGEVRWRGGFGEDGSGPW